MTKAKTISVLLSLVLSTAFAFAQHEELMERAHGVPRDRMLQAFLESNNIDENTSLEKLQEAVAYYYENEDRLLFDYDVERHKVIVSGVSQARASRQAQWGQALNGMLSGVAQAVDISQQQAKAEREAKQAQAERDRQQRLQARAAEKQAATSQSSSVDPSVYTAAANARSNSIQDLYTSDMNWNRTLDLMVRQYGVEKTRQKVQEMRASEIQDRAQAQQQSYELQQKSADNQRAAVTTARNQTSLSSGSSGEMITTAITTNRTQIYLLIEGGKVNSYATGKDAMGKYNWKYVGVGINDIKLTPYGSQFGNEYSRAANIIGVGYVFFN